MNIYCLDAMGDEEDVSLIDPLSKEWDGILFEKLNYVHKPMWTRNSVRVCLIPLTNIDD
jgi:hypothetical protein